MDRATIYRELCKLEREPPTTQNARLAYLLRELAGKAVRLERKVLEARSS